jgi:hypothetical protein
LLFKAVQCFPDQTFPALQIDRARERILFHDFSKTSFQREGRPCREGAIYI